MNVRQAKARGYKVPSLTSAVVHSSEVAGPEVASGVAELRDALVGRVPPPPESAFFVTAWDFEAPNRTHLDEGWIVLACNVTLIACRRQREFLELMVTGKGA